MTTSWERWYWRQSSKDGRGFMLETIRDDVSWERKNESKGEEIRYIREEVGNCLNISSGSSWDVS